MKKIIFASIMLTGVSFSLYSQIQKGDFALGLNSSFSNSNSTQTPEIYSGNGQDYHRTDSKSNQSNYSFGPELSYFISNRFAIGANINYNWGKSSNNYMYGNLDPYENFISDSKNEGLNSTIFLKYFIPVGEKAAFSIEAGPRIGFSNQESNISTVYFNQRGNGLSSSNNDITSTNSTFYGGYISPAFIFFPAYRWGVQLSIGNLLNATVTNSKIREDKNYNDPDPNVYLHSYSNSHESTRNDINYLNIHSMSAGISVYYFFRKKTQ